MAEALGTAVGVVSLGIQVCQGLISYYEAWESYHGDIESACNKVSELEKTLALLKSILDHPNLDPKRRVRVQESLMAYKVGLDSLEKKYEKVRAVDQPSGFRERVKAVTMRTTYPFKVSTIAKVSETVHELRNRLMLALQVSQLDTGVEARAELSAIGTGLRVMENECEPSGRRMNSQRLRIG